MDTPTFSTQKYQACRITHIPSQIVVESRDQATGFSNWLFALGEIAYETALRGMPAPTAKELKMEIIRE